MTAFLDATRQNKVCFVVCACFVCGGFFWGGRGGGGVGVLIVLQYLLISTAVSVWLCAL